MLGMPLAPAFPCVGFLFAPGTGGTGSVDDHASAVNGADILYIWRQQHGIERLPYTIKDLVALTTEKMVMEGWAIVFPAVCTRFRKKAATQVSPFPEASRSVMVLARTMPVNHSPGIAACPR